MSSPIDVTTWSAYLLPIARHFRKPDNDSLTTLSTKILRDSFGNHIDFGHTVPNLLKEPLFELIAGVDHHSIEINGIDKGRLFYTLQTHKGFHILSQTKVDLYGSTCLATSHVILPSLEIIKTFIESL